MRTSRRITASGIGLLLAGCLSDSPVEPSRPGATGALDVQPAAAGRITVLEDLGGTDGSTATGINAIGQIVGYSSAATGGWHAVIWESGTMTDLGAHVPPPGGDSFAGDIGDGGHVAGTTNTAEGESGSTFAVVWEDGIPRRLDRLAEPLRATAMAVNASGTVVGGAYNADGFEQPVLWDARGIVDLGLPGGGRAWDINDKGQIVGQTTSPTGSWGAFLWQNGSVRDLGTLAGGNTFATGINEAGQVVGWSSSNWRDEEHAFLWADGRMTDLGTLGGSRSAALDINDNGQVVGYSTTSINDAAAALTRTLYAYDASADRWSVKAPMPVAGGCGGSAAIGGRLYVFSGCIRSSSGGKVGARLLQRYDPGTNSWTTLRSAPGTHFSPAVGAIGGKLYVAGGSNDAGIATRRLDMYDPATNTWFTRAQMPTPRMETRGAAIAGRFYVVGGRSASGSLYRDAVEAYDPVANSWSTRADMIAPRAGFGVGAVNGILYVVGGRNQFGTLRLNERYTP